MDSVEIKSRKIIISPINTIVPHPRNRNRHSVEQLDRLTKGIKSSGFREPLTVSKQTGLLICGHARFEVAKKLKMDKVPVVYQDFTDEKEEYQHMTFDNEIARWAELDIHGLKVDLEQIKFDMDIDLLGIESMPSFVEPKEAKEEKKEAAPKFHECPDCGCVFNDKGTQRSGQFNQEIGSTQSTSL